MILKDEKYINDFLYKREATDNIEIYDTNLVK